MEVSRYVRKNQILALSALTAAAWGFNAHADGKGVGQGRYLEELPICYIPGAGGSNDFSMKEFPKELAARGIRFIPIDVGERGTVQVRAQRFVEGLSAELKANPSFRCHVFGYSMGGLLARYSYHHLSVDAGQGLQVPMRDIAVSITTFSSPHKGTPLAEWVAEYAPGLKWGLEQLSEEGVRLFNEPEFEDTYSPTPTEIPTFSYGTWVESEDETDMILHKIGFQYITQRYEQRGWDTRNDGVVPLLSQEFGTRVANLRVGHSFFDKDMGLRPWAPDLYELHWRSMTGTLKDSVAQWDEVAAALPDFEGVNELR